MIDNVYDYGLKTNWSEFKYFAELGGQWDYIFVYSKDDPDRAYMFFNDSKFEDWLEKIFWDWCRYEDTNLEDSMDDIEAWKLVPESHVKRWTTLYKNAKPTSIVIDEERQYRQKKIIVPEQTIQISVSDW